MSPGSVPTNATEIYQEGVRIPPLKYRDGGEVNRTLVDLLTLNVRMPETFMGDLNAQVAACSIGARRVGELAERYGSNHLPAIAEELLGRSERLARRAIERIPDGRYRHVDWLDNDGVALDEPVRIEVTVEIAGDRVLIDFEGTNPQVRGPFNCVPSGAYAGAWFAVLAMTDSSIPINGGVLSAGRASPPGREHRESARARAGQLAHLHHQAHRGDDHRRAPPGAARGRSRRCSLRPARPRVRRHARGRLALGGRRAHRVGQRCKPGQGWRGRHRDRRLQLHEPPGRGAGDGRADSDASLRVAARLRRARGIPGRTRHQPGVRGAGGRGRVHPPGRTAPASGPGCGRRWPGRPLRIRSSDARTVRRR